MSSENLSTLIGMQRSAVEARNAEIAAHFSLVDSELSTAAIEESLMALGLDKTEGKKPVEIKKKIPKTRPDVSNVLTITSGNLDEMRAYYAWSRHQARIICWVAIGACVVGILVIIAAFIMSLIKSLSFDKTLITAIGGMVTEVFAGTTLLVYRSSIKQLNYYHKSLHEDQRFLASIDLLWRFSSDVERDKMLAAIIRNSLKINLATATENENDDEDAKQDKPETSVSLKT